MDVIRGYVSADALDRVEQGIDFFLGVLIWEEIFSRTYTSNNTLLEVKYFKKTGIEEYIYITFGK